MGEQFDHPTMVGAKVSSVSATFARSGSADRAPGWEKLVAMANPGGPRPGEGEETRYQRRPRRKGRRPRHSHAMSYRRSWQRKVAFTVAILAIAGGMAIGADIYRFFQHSGRVGSALIHTEEHAAAAARASGKCVASFPASTPSAGVDVSAASPGAALAPSAPAGAADGANPTVYALLEASSIGLVAPVVDGVGDAQLSVAVGHVPASSWPGTDGTSVLAAHDVTWFSQIDQLTPGDQISVVTPCETFVYTVADHQVVSADTPILQSASSRLVLITCYPVDALFLTSQRYLVDADLSRVVDAGTQTRTASRAKAGAPSASASVAAAAVPASVAAPEVPAPPALVSQGLDLAHNSAPMGSLSVIGSPSISWEQSSGPLNDTAAVVSLYFAAIRSAEQGEGDWWVAIAPDVAYASASPLMGATIVYNNSTLSPVLDVSGSALTGVSLETEPVLSGNDFSGLYRIQMTADVVNDQLIVSGWSMQRIGG
jgi:sortase A